MADWFHLPRDLMELIARRITRVADHLKFSWVCSSWRSIALEFRPNFPSPFPVLMVPYGHGKNGNTRCLFSLSNSKPYKHDLAISEREHIVGSSGGSVVYVDEHLNVQIANPFSNVRVPLPSVNALPKPGPEEEDMPEDTYGYVSRAAFSSSDPHNTLVVVAYGTFRRLAFAKPGDDSWTLIGDFRSCEDVIFYKGQFYGVNCVQTTVCDIGPHPKATQIMPVVQHWNGLESKNYLVECAGELLLVKRYWSWINWDGEDDNSSDGEDNDGIFDPRGECYTTFFEVYKLDTSTHTWNQVQSLGDRSLFLGLNTSFSLSSSDYEECMGNCIYFTDDYVEGRDSRLRGGYDMGIFNLQDQSIQPYIAKDSKLIQPVPTWVTPLPWKRKGSGIVCSTRRGAGTSEKLLI